MQKRFYNLDGLRFIAAWIVLVSHIEVLKPFFGLESNKGRFSLNGAQLAVTFFFVLSGFLIAFLLLQEKKMDPDHRINSWRFYKKRICRIWPLYYALVLIVFLVLRNSNLFAGLEEVKTSNDFPVKRFAGYMLFLPNTTEINFGKELCLGQTWSLGVEEFFYLFFPLLINFVPVKSIRKVLVFIIILFLILSIGIYFIKDNTANSKSGLLSIYLDRYRIYAFGFGALAASWMVFPAKENAFMKELKRKMTAIFLLIVSAILVIVGTTFSIATQQCYALLFSLLIFSMTSSGIRIGFLNHRIPVYLGKISYGIYMLHPLALILLFKIWKPLSSGFGTTIALIAAGTGITVLLAAVSYECYEKYFIRWARRKEKTVSG